jgi:hypothetical protein
MRKARSAATYHCTDVQEATASLAQTCVCVCVCVCVIHYFLED